LFFFVVLRVLRGYGLSLSHWFLPFTLLSCILLPNSPKEPHPSMEMSHAIFLGALQGFTEILPISSSAHLILVPRILGWPPSGLTFDVAVHAGTLLALLAYFRRDLLDMVASTIQGVTDGFRTTSSRLLPIIIAATLPAALAGRLAEAQIENWFRSSPALVATVMMVFGLLLGLADLLGHRTLRLDRLGLGRGMVIGCAQALALIPGVSRSGITITAGLFLGFSREASARFSFLLSLPVVAGAALLKGGELLQAGIPEGVGLSFLAGIVASSLCGYISVALLMQLLQKRGLGIFVWYRLLAGGAFLIWFNLTP
jgi:undecaprenyl-diphosphatase